MASEFSVQLANLARDFRLIPADVRRRMRPALQRAAQPIIAEARANASQWSYRIPSSIKLSVLKTGVMIRVSSKTAPHARPYEGIGTRRKTFRHPVFGNREYWVEQRTRPFLMPAVRRHRAEVHREVERTIDRVLRLHGYR